MNLMCLDEKVLFADDEDRPDFDIIDQDTFDHFNEMTSDAVAHIINMLNLLIDSLPAGFINEDAQPALDELADKVNNKDEE